ncbi:MAG: lytic transglycosylase, lysM domain [Deltaproteobacteria bacterium]|nr:lytic transglycosylase, lysM domain [Deltaproteobacteria bacterium]
MVSSKQTLIKWTFIILMCVVLFPWSAAYGQGPNLSSPSFLVSSLKIGGPLDFCGERVPIETQEVRERLEKELLLTLWNQPQVILWLKRSRRYFPYIEEKLKDGGVPDDLKYVAIAESALQPHVGSPKGAMGFWQFIESTGQKYGLVINKHIDQRRNIFASTQAAIRYFKYLYETFGSWTLAAAAYNMGEDGLMAEIVTQGTDNFYLLHLPLETQRYILRIVVVKLIASDPKRYSFQLSDEDYYPPLAFDRIQIELFKDVPLRLIAQAAGTHFKTIKDLNPEIRGHYLPAGRHEILLPRGASNDFQVRFQPLLKNLGVDERDRIYVVKKGDTLTSIAERFNVPLSALIIWNRLDPRAHLRPGDQLVIHRIADKSSPP